MISGRDMLGTGYCAPQTSPPLVALVASRQGFVSVARRVSPGFQFAQKRGTPSAGAAAVF